MSVVRAQPLNAAQAGRFRQAMQLLQSGARAQALGIAESLAAQAPGAADAWQLLGMCLGGNGRPSEALDAFDRALALAPGNRVVSRNYALFLAGYGRELRARERLLAAEPVLRRAVELAPDLAFAWVDLGAVLRLLGRVDGALEAYGKARQILRQRGEDPVDVSDAINGTLADAGRAAEALAGARDLADRYPGHAPAQETLANLLWEHAPQLAPGEDPLDGFRAAARAQPDNRPLQLALARMLLSARRGEEALSLLHPLRRRDPDDPLLRWFAADALDLLDRPEEAASLYALAGRKLGALPEFLNAHARHAFRARRPDLASQCARRVIEVDPRNQEGWSHLATAWRLARDPREDWLCGYERLVGEVEVEPPPGFDGMAGFLQALAAQLELMHGAGREPVSQSVRGGTQTAGQLFGRDDPTIQAAANALHRAAEGWLASLPVDPDHPFLGAPRRDVEFKGSWSVRLRSSGRHSNHIHPKGWLSSAFYVALPDCVGAGGDAHAGWIQFGQPLDELGLDLSPRRVIQPRPGSLVLFPSYMWHGTVPFEGPQSRLTIAFDMQPKA